MSPSDAESLALASALSGYRDSNDPPISPPHTPRPAPAAVLPPELILKILNDASKVEQMDAMTSPIIRPRETILMDVEECVEEGQSAEKQEPEAEGEKMDVDQPEGREETK